MKQTTLDQFFARKPPDDPCSKEEKNSLKRKAEEPKKGRRKRAKPNTAMTHAPWWDARTQQLLWVFPVDEAYVNTPRKVGWMDKMGHHSSQPLLSCPIIGDCPCHEEKEVQTTT
jgi:hypothetical protein